MPRVPIGRLKPGWFILNPVCDTRGNLLLAPGVQLKDRYIEQLRQTDLPAVDVTFSPRPDGGPAPLPTPALRGRITRSLAAAVAAIRAKTRRDPLDLVECVEHLVRAVIRQPAAMVGLSDIRPARGYLYAHSVNVCLLAVLIGRELGYAFADLVELGLGALLHDVGLAVSAPASEAKPPHLAVDTATRRRHPRTGFRLLMAQGWISARSALVALEHHAGLDGSGYPDTVRGTRISDFGGIVAVADLYDTLSSDQPHRAGLVPARCIALLRRLSGRALRPAAVEALIKHIALYPEGTLVRLSTGDIGVVAELEPTSPARPVVTLIADGAWSPVPPRTVRLADEPAVEVAEQMTVLAHDLTSAAADAPPAGHEVAG